LELEERCSSEPFTEFQLVPVDNYVKLSSMIRPIAVGIEGF
jgi:hypothetical protein